MTVSRSTIAAALAGAGAVAAIVAAPSAAAEPTCTQVGNALAGSNTVCQTPGNAQVTSSPGQLSQTQYGMWPWGYGGYVGIGIL